MRPKVECFVSPLVSQEASRGNREFAQRRLAAIAPFSVLTVSEEIQELARKYFSHFGVPVRARLDAAHLAVAAWHSMDYVLSWNCKHIASARVQKLMREVNEKLGVHTPVVCTPEELMEV